MMASNDLGYKNKEIKTNFYRINLVKSIIQGGSLQLLTEQAKKKDRKMKNSFVKMIMACLCICVSTSVFGGPKTVLTEAEQKAKDAKYKAFATENLKVDKPALEDACINAKKSGKYVLVVVKSKSCSWCRIMDKILKNDTTIAPIVESNYVQVNINYSSFKTLLPDVQYIGMIPNFAVLSWDKKLVKRFNPVSIETKNPSGYDKEKLHAFFLEWAPNKDKSAMPAVASLTNTVPLNIEPGEQGKVQCVDAAKYQYDLYLPSSYGKGKLLPIIYTSSPGGGGMVNAYKAMGEELQVIVVGELAYRNNRSISDIIGSVFAMLRDVRQRIEFDPTAQFTAGMSGGAWQSYSVARWNSTSICGVMAMGGWLGMQYEPWFRHGTGLLVARGAGVDDKGSNRMSKRDSTFLSRFNATVKDWSFPGGHVDAPTPVKVEMLQWLLDERTSQDDVAQKSAEAQWAEWNTKCEQGNDGTVFVECVEAVLEHPRTWIAYEAKKIIDRQLQDYSKFQGLSLDGLPTGQYAEDYFGFIAYGSGMAGDADTFHSALKCFQSCGNCDPEWARILASIMLFAPNDDVRDMVEGQQLLQEEIKRNPNNDSLKMLSAAYYIKKSQFAEAALLLEDIQLPALKYSGPVADKITKNENIAYKQIEKSIAEKKDLIKGDVWLQILPD